MPKVKQFNKEKVLSAAAQIFKTKGYNGTSIDDILKITGLSRSSLYDSFSDKHALYLQALEYYKNNEHNIFEQADSKALNPIEKIEFVFNEAVDKLISDPKDNGSLLVNAAAEMGKLCAQTSSIIQSSKTDMQEIFTNWVGEAHQQKLINLTMPAKNYGVFLFNSLCGLRLLSQSGASKLELKNVVKVTLDALKK
jgi:TetR/AcrR family transcriptional repressor of nem operon